MSDPKENDTDVNINAEFTSESVQQIDETARLLFAKQILIGLFAFSALVLGAYVFMPTNEALKGIFEIVKIGILPLVTLVIAFYFTPTK